MIISAVLSGSDPKPLDRYQSISLACYAPAVLPSVVAISLVISQYLMEEIAPFQAFSHYKTDYFQPKPKLRKTE